MCMRQRERGVRKQERERWSYRENERGRQKIFLSDLVNKKKAISNKEIREILKKGSTHLKYFDKDNKGGNGREG